MIGQDCPRSRREGHRAKTHELHPAVLLHPHPSKPLLVSLGSNQRLAVYSPVSPREAIAHRIKSHPLTSWMPLVHTCSIRANMTSANSEVSYHQHKQARAGTKGPKPAYHSTSTLSSGIQGSQHFVSPNSAFCTRGFNPCCTWAIISRRTGDRTASTIR